VSEQTKPESKPDDLTKTAEPNSIELTDEALKGVSGGAEKSGTATASSSGVTFLRYD
jgi:hypothetical protein